MLKCTCIYSFSKKTTRELFAHHSSHVYSSWDARGMKWTPHLFFTTAPKNETLCHATLSFMDWAKFWQLHCRSSGLISSHLYPTITYDISTYMNDFANNKKGLLTKLEITEDCSLYTSYLKGK